MLNSVLSLLNLLFIYLALLVIISSANFAALNAALTWLCLFNLLVNYYPADGPLRWAERPWNAMHWGTLFVGEHYSSETIHRRLFIGGYSLEAIQWVVFIGQSTSGNNMNDEYKSHNLHANLHLPLQTRLSNGRTVRSNSEIIAANFAVIDYICLTRLIALRLTLVSFGIQISKLRIPSQTWRQT